MVPFWRREPSATLHSPSAATSAEVEDLRAQVKALARDLDDLDDTVRRLRGRRSKTEALDEAANGHPVASRGRAGLPSIATLRASGRSPFGGGGSP